MGRANLQERRESCSPSLEKIPLCSLPHDLAAGASGFFMEGCLGQNGSTRELSDESEELVRVARSAVVEDLVRDPSGLRGHLSQEVQEKVVAAVRRATTLSLLEQVAIVEALGG